MSIEANEFELKKKLFRLESFLNLTLTQIMVQANRKKLALTVEKDPNLPEMIYTDESRLEQILLNLLTNAVKYTSKGSISLKISRDENLLDSLRFQVSDSGIGMSQERLLELFESFDNENISTLMEQKATKSIFAYMIYFDSRVQVNNHKLVMFFFGKGSKSRIR